MNRLAPLVAGLALPILVVSLAVSSIACLATGPRAVDAPTAREHIQVRGAGSRVVTRGPADRFTGTVSVTQLFGAMPDTRASAGTVTFEPGARSVWHSHPAGQTLIVTSGTGWVQEWGGAKQTIEAGDVVWIPPGMKHWHGATATESMTHIAIQDQVGGSIATWMDPVSDAQYLH